MSEKKEVLELIKSLPEDATYEEMMREIYIYIKFQQGVREYNEKRTENTPINLKQDKWFH